MFTRVDRISSEEVVLTDSEEYSEEYNKGAKEEEFSKVDGYGCRKVPDGWLNIFTRNITEQHPLSERDNDDVDEKQVSPHFPSIEYINLYVPLHTYT